MSECNIKNNEAHAQRWDWGFLNGCFGDSGIKISDIDGMVERNRHILFIETKAPTDIVKTGQRRAHAAMARWQENSVLCIWGPIGEPRFMQLWEPGEIMPRARVECDRQDIINFVSNWYRRAERYRWHSGHSRNKWFSDAP